MKVSENWLRSWVNPEAAIEEIAEQLTMAGLEVKSLERLIPQFSRVLVGRVKEVRRHPDADTLSVCIVDAGQDELLQIVCGAPNVRAGCSYPVALVGARLPGGIKIRATKLRGVQSNGMLCSEAELGFGEDSDGIMELAGSPQVGMEIQEYLGLDDTVFELELTPNKGDCLGIVGIAREIAALNAMPFEMKAVQVIASKVETILPVELLEASACPIYLGRVIECIDIKAVTPEWMRERLRRSGLRPLQPVVDVTNYVLLELGQPMHAFDLEKLNGGIKVRKARRDEPLTLLDGREVTLDTDMLVIADHLAPVALAGIMGGLHSAVTGETTSIFLESAFFSPISIVGRGRRLGLHTDASHRFERGVDPSIQHRAIERATQLILEICGGQAGPVIVARDDNHVPLRKQVLLRRDRLTKVLGVAVPDVQVTAMLTRLGLKLTETDDGWLALPPMHRFDLEIEEDLIEEVARIYGYSEIPEIPLHSDVFVPRVAETTVENAMLGDRLVSLGYQEIVSYSFVDPGLQGLLFPESEGIALSNPISSELSVMRISLWPGLLQALGQNVSRQQERIRIFEIGVKFNWQHAESKEINSVAGLAFGPVSPEQWGQKPAAVDLFDIKSDVEAILRLGGAFHEFQFQLATHPALHPGQSARITRQGSPVGWIGALHPNVQASLGLRQSVFVFELEIDTVTRAKMPLFKPISKFPRVRRDIALVLSEAIAAEDILAVARAVGGDLLVDCLLFDVYQGSGIDSGLKSVALGLILQESSRTLTDQEADHVVVVVGEAVKNEFGAQIRD
ncbi:MAG: phenylalanine--tRNA ligase subunit beta [Gammaproteobacteria bacterium]|nr:phenylalanine--tRNA ligase subunit beta [Gammaproteobacteria bacterium]